MKTNCKKSAEKIVQMAKFSKRYTGYKFMIPCVELAAENDSRLCSLVKEIYQPVADLYGVNYQDVERNLRTARDYAWQNGGKEFVEQVSGGTFSSAPAVGELIEILADYLCDH